MIQGKEQLLSYLKSYSSKLSKAINKLEQAYDKSKALGISWDKAELPEQDLEALEVLTARFARLSDILVQKIFGLIDELELEPRGSVIDRINRAAKRGLISSPELFSEIRFLRNEIVHEYSDEARLNELFKTIYSMSPSLIESSKKILGFIDNYGKA